MNELEITQVVAISLFALLLLASIYNYFFSKNNNQHLMTYDEDVDLYFFKKNIDMQHMNKPTIDKNEEIKEELENHENVTIPTETDEKVDVVMYSRSALTNDDGWLAERTTSKRDFILFKMQEIENSNYVSYYHFKDTATNKLYAQKYLDSNRYENENLDVIRKFAVKNSNIELLYIGKFGFTSVRVSSTFDLR